MLFRSRLRIYRNKTAGTPPSFSTDTFYLVAEVPNNSIGTNQFLDSTPDSSLGVPLVVPEKTRGLPPRSRHISAFRNKLFSVMAEFNDTIAWSDEHPETFPPDDNSVVISMNRGSKVVATAPNNDEVIVFKDRGISSVGGDFDTFVRVREIGHDLGCVSHSTIQNIHGATFFASDQIGRAHV